MRLIATLGLIFASVFLSGEKCLSQIAEGQGKFVGCAVSLPIPQSFLTYWNQVTPADEGKFGRVASLSADTSLWIWSSLDQIYDFALIDSIPFKEHNLVWGQEQPSWIGSLDSSDQYQDVVNWIRLCGERYPKTAMVDVVNEPLHDTPQASQSPVPYYNALGGAGSTGWDWVITAFTLARKYFPNAKLLINEYYILNSDPSDPYASVYKYVNIINLLKQRNLIDGIGCEMHFLEQQDSSVLRANLDILAATGVPIYITEYTINESSDVAQLSIIENQFPVFWKHPAVKGITFFGYIQGQVWNRTPNCFLIYSNGSVRPALTWLMNYVAENPTGIKKTILPSSPTLDQNFPDPFNPTTVIRYQLSATSRVSLKVYDVLGREIETLVDERETPGTHSVSFDAAKFPSGVYFYRLVTGNFNEVKKLVLIK